MGIHLVTSKYSILKILRKKGSQATAIAVCGNLLDKSNAPENLNK